MDKGPLRLSVILINLVVRGNGENDKGVLFNSERDSFS